MIVLSLEEVNERLENGSPILLPEGIHPTVAEKAIRRIYGVPETVAMRILPRSGNGKHPPNALVSIIPPVSLAEQDPNKIRVTFRQMQ